MKRNVDLTLDRKFSQPVFIGGLRGELFRLVSDVKFPWEMNMKRILRTINSDDSDSLLLTGDRDDRRRKRNEIQFRNGTHCECCGIELNKKPWLRGEYTVCSKCDFRIEYEHYKSYWIELMKQKMHIKRIRIVKTVDANEFKDIVSQIEE